jgi:hypothetical protein
MGLRVKVSRFLRNIGTNLLIFLKGSGYYIILLLLLLLFKLQMGFYPVAVVLQ